MNLGDLFESIDNSDISRREQILEEVRIREQGLEPVFYQGPDAFTGRVRTSQGQMPLVSNLELEPGVLGIGALSFDVGERRKRRYVRPPVQGEVTVLATVFKEGVWEVWLGGDRKPELIATVPLQPTGVLELIGPGKRDWIVSLKYGIDAQCTIACYFGQNPTQNWSLIGLPAFAMQYRGRGFWSGYGAEYEAGNFATVDDIPPERHYSGFILVHESPDLFTGVNDYLNTTFDFGQYTQIILRNFDTQVYGYSVSGGVLSKYIGRYFYTYSFSDERDTLENNYQGQTVDSGLDIRKTLTHELIRPGIQKTNEASCIRPPNQFAQVRGQYNETIYFPSEIFLEDGVIYQKSVLTGEKFCDVVTGIGPEFFGTINSKVYLDYQGTEIEVGLLLSGFNSVFQPGTPWPIITTATLENNSTIFVDNLKATVKRHDAAIVNNKLEYILTNEVSKPVRKMDIGTGAQVLAVACWN
jgi:hypothetical protein